MNPRRYKPRRLPGQIKNFIGEQQVLFGREDQNVDLFRWRGGWLFVEQQHRQPGNVQLEQGVRAVL